jgi:succinate dehydrogenase / fumarate reductase membrane anchor subunit
MPRLHDPFANSLTNARGLGAGRHAVSHWKLQRITAIANLPLVIWLILSLLHLKGASHDVFITWLAHPIHAILMILFVLSAFLHASLGAQVVIEDYVHCKFMLIAKLVGQKLFFIALAVACLFSILKIAL